MKQLKFQTLFYIFYNCPHDTKQTQAHLELESRGWQFIKEENEWQHKRDALRFDLAKWAAISLDFS